MAILLLIGSDVTNEPYQYHNDVIGIFDDDHDFSEDELAQFQLLTVNGTKEDVKAKFLEICPKIALAYHRISDDKWTFDNSEDYDNQVLVWFEAPNKWYKLINPFKFPTNIGSLTPEEKQLCETYDINHPSVTAFINKIAKDITSDPANNEEIRDLRGSEPL